MLYPPPALDRPTDDPEPNGTKTIVADVEFANLYTQGVLCAAVGLVTRIFARTIVWCQDQLFHWRSETITYWEAIWIDLGMIGMVFGLALILLGVWRRIR